MAGDADYLIKMVRDIEDALLIVHHRVNELKLRLLRVDLEVKVTARRSAEAGGSFPVEFVPVEISAKRERTRGQTFTLALTPAGGARDLGPAVSSELADAILAAADAVKKLTEISGQWRPGDMTVTVNVGWEKSGRLVAWFGGAATNANTHTIKLTLTRS